MLFGKCPFADLSMVQKIAAITNEEPKILYPSLADPLAIDVVKKYVYSRSFASHSPQNDIYMLNLVDVCNTNTDVSVEMQKNVSQLRNY